MTLEERRNDLVKLTNRTLVQLEQEVPSILQIIEKHGIKVSPYTLTSNGLTIEVDTEEAFKAFPTKMLGELLPLLGQGFKRFISAEYGRVYYHAETPFGFTIYIRVGPANCKVKKQTTKKVTESLEEKFIFETDCDPLMLDVEKGKTDGE